MPSHTVHGALVKLWFALAESPWSFSAWQDITGVTNGLFPLDDSQLPKGWTRKSADDIASYFQQFRDKKSEDERIKFAGLQRRVGNDTIPGRALWRKWVTDNYSKHWDIHGRIARALTDANIHPLQLMKATGDFDDFPGASSYLPLGLDPIARSLFGPESFDKSNHLKRELREPTLMLAQRTWGQLRKGHVRDVEHLRRLRQVMDAALAGE
jgi:TATA-binding protein-associated factor